MNNIDLFNDLLHSETEESVIHVLKEYALWECDSCWKPYGGIDNNLSIILAQQKDPFAAFAEKVVNSIDATLLRECKRENINPESKEAPSTLNKAILKYDKNIQVDDVQIYATGNEKNYLNLIIADYGEGQSPNYFETTLLSLNKSNKLRIPFVQGKFNMGSTGVLPFCGKHNFQLMLSKKDPRIHTLDEESDSWSFTITRKNSSDQHTKSSVIEYLVINNKVPRLEHDTLNILPDKKVASATYTMPMKWGTYLKLFNYQTKHNSLIKGRFTFKLSHLLPGLPLKIFVADRRDLYNTTSNKLSTILRGNRERMMDNSKGTRLVKGFPHTNIVTINNQRIPVEIFLIKKLPNNDNSAFKDDEGIVYIVNGQVHGYSPHRIFNKKGIDLSYIYKNILVYVDITDIEKEYREELLMSNRESLRDSIFRQKLENLVIAEIKHSKQLYVENERVRKELLKDKVQNDTHIINSLKKVLKNNPTIASLFEIGNQLKDKQKIERGIHENIAFIGSDEPTYFDITQDYTILNPKEVASNKNFRLTFKTDVKNDFFTRETNQGIFTLLSEEGYNFDYSLSLKNGLCTIIVTLPKGIKTQSIISFNSLTKSLSKNFENQFIIRVTKAEVKKSNPSKHNKKKNHTSLNLPNMVGIYKKDWSDYNFSEISVLSINGNDFIINMDNTYLLKTIRHDKQNADQYQEEFKAIFMMYGLALEHKNSEIESDDEKINIEQATSALAPVVFETSQILEELRK